MMIISIITKAPATEPSLFSPKIVTGQKTCLDTIMREMMQNNEALRGPSGLPARRRWIRAVLLRSPDLQALVVG